MILSPFPRVATSNLGGDLTGHSQPYTQRLLFLAQLSLIVIHLLVLKHTIPLLLYLHHTFFTMPKHTRSSSAAHNPYAHAMPVSLAPSQPLDIGYNGRQQHMSLNTAFYQTIPNNMTAQAAMASQAYDPYPTAPAAAMPQSIPHRASSGAWSPQDDKNLIAARQQGLNWNQIQTNYFPNKTSNACRKRHERLMERKGADDWDARRLEKIAKEYMTMRKEIWQPLAQRVGEKWQVVEARVSVQPPSPSLR